MGSAAASLADVSGFLNPRSIAVVGASEGEHSLGGAAVRFLTKFHYPGDVWPVHPRAATVAGLPAYPGVDALPGVPDLVVFAIAAARVPGAVREYGKAGVRNGVVWAGGFSEGGAEGERLQHELVAACEETGLAVLGPNCIGLISTEQPVIASFASFMREVDALPRGNISMMGQSGGLVTMAMAKAQARGLGFRYAVSTGNEAVLSTADFIAACAQDAGTRVIAAYVEGVSDGPRLLAALDVARAEGKPVVVLRGGSSAAAARAAAAHTGALAGESRVWDAVLREFGVVAVSSLEELVDVVEQLSRGVGVQRPDGTGVALVTFGGGGGVLAADQCERRGLTTPRLSDETRARLAPLVPSIASVLNPVDLTPQVYSDPQHLDLLPEALGVIAADPAVDSVLLQYGPMGAGAARIARIAEDFMAASPVPVLLGWPLAPAEASAYAADHGLPVFDEYDRAIRVLADLAASNEERPEPPAPAVELDWERLLPDARAGLVVAEHGAYRLLSAAGLPVAASRLVEDADQAVAAAGDLGWPVAMKVMSATVTHKFAAGLVRLGVDSPEAAARAMDELTARAAELGAAPEGVLVQHMVTGGTEILVSALRDPSFGVVVSCGAGGVMTEAIDDVVLHRAPFGPEVAEAMLRRLRVVRRALAKGQPDLRPMVGFLTRFAQVAATAPWRSFVVEVNPVKWTDDEAVAVDGLVLVEEV